MLAKLKSSLKAIAARLKAIYNKVVNKLQSFKSKVVIKQTVLTIYAKFISSFNIGKSTSNLLFKEMIITTNVLIYE